MKEFNIYMPKGGSLNDSCLRGIYEYECVLSVMANSLEQVWSFAQNHNALYELLDLRSLSVGDILSDGNTYHMITGRGFTEVPRTVVTYIDWTNHAHKLN